MARVEAPGDLLVEGDEVIASRWRRRWRGARRRIQGAFLVGVLAVPVAFRAVGSEDLWGPVAAFGVLVLLFTMAHLWAGARMWMQATSVTNEGIAATRVARLVAPRQFARWAEVAEARVTPWSGYGDRIVLRLRGGGSLHTIPGELDEKSVALVLHQVEAARDVMGAGGGQVAGP